MDVFIGISGFLLFIIKIGIHIYIRHSSRKKLSLGSFGHFTNPVYFLPMMEKVENKLKTIQIVGNVIYCAAIALIVIFLVMVN